MAVLLYVILPYLSYISTNFQVILTFPREVTNFLSELHVKHVKQSRIIDS